MKTRDSKFKGAQMSQAKAVKYLLEAKRQFPNAVRFLSNRLMDGLEFSPELGCPVMELPSPEILSQWTRSKFIYLSDNVQMLEPEILKALKDAPMNRSMSAPPPSGRGNKANATGVAKSKRQHRTEADEVAEFLNND